MAYDLFRLCPQFWEIPLRELGGAFYFGTIPSKLIAETNNIPVFHFGVIKCNSNVAVP